MKFPPPSFSISFPHQTASLSLFSLDPLLGMHVQSYQILNSEDHANILRKHNKNPSDYRPDIIHQRSLSSWTMLLMSYDRGAYLVLRSFVMRTHRSKHQREAFKRASAEQLEPVFEADVCHAYQGCFT
ncbi:uncharacterized protein LOC104883743 isoform X3 [Beta vulgaris subsp. vulgaris]|uniref:uncharacterized protein LOC104883743 isoform X3 n=1 Tax=Beta vulgaris subsp. vulgaris TaxID=3555 RepID=UPI0020367E6B|nr:uncharacterized protein LOC104883743 isoform X3 [Beta vulgaris subsp. vulgaris]